LLVERKNTCLSLTILLRRYLLFTVLLLASFVEIQGTLFFCAKHCMMFFMRYHFYF
jgi:hypothetical protein